MGITYTKHLRLPVPDFLTEPWDDEFRALMDAIDQIFYDSVVVHLAALWVNSHVYAVGNVVISPDNGLLYTCAVAHTSTAGPQTFTAELAAHPTFWVAFAPLLATQAEAVAGTENTHYMSALRVAQAIAALTTSITIASQAEAEAGTDNTKAMTALRTVQSLNVRYPKGYISGCITSPYVGNPAQAITVSAGACATTAGVLMTLAGGDKGFGAWSPGMGSNALDTGAIGNGWYYVYVIMRTDLTNVDLLVSLSATAPTMPAGYTHKRRIGAFLRAAGANVLWTQTGDIFYWNTAIADANVAAPPATAVTRTLTVPPGVVGIMAMLNVAVTAGAGSADGVLISSLDVVDVAANSPTGNMTAYSIVLGASNFTAMAPIRCVAGQVRSRQAIGGAGSALYIVTQGWIDTRGRQFDN